MRTTIDLPDRVHRELRRRAIDRHASMSQLAAQLLEESLFGRHGAHRIETAADGFKTVRLGREVTSADVAALEDEW